MAAGQFNSAYFSVGHGVTNWDTALRGDMSNVSGSINALVGADGAFGYNATGVNWGSNWVTRLRVSGNQVTFNLGANPGSNGYTTASANNLIGTIPAGTSPNLFRPSGNVYLPCTVLNADGSYGGFGGAFILPDGRVILQGLSIPQITSGMGLVGTASWQAQ